MIQKEVREIFHFWISIGSFLLILVTIGSGFFWAGTITRDISYVKVNQEKDEIKNEAAHTTIISRVDAEELKINNLQTDLSIHIGKKIITGDQ